VLQLIEGFESEIARRAKRKYSGDEASFVISTAFRDITEADLAEANKMIKHRYHVVKEITKQEIARFKEQIQAPARVLMVGCAGSYDLAQLVETYAVTAIELNEDVFEVAQLENPQADVLLMDVRDYEIQENSFKGIWARSSMHYLHDADQEIIFEKLARGLVQDGVMQIIVREGDTERYEEETIGGKKVRNFVNPMTYDQIRQLAEGANLEIITLESHRLSHKWLAVLLRKR
jgi:SAM-dependent methyltransferase